MKSIFGCLIFFDRLGKVRDLDFLDRIELLRTLMSKTYLRAGKKTFVSEKTFHN